MILQKFQAICRIFEIFCKIASHLGGKKGRWVGSRSKTLATDSYSVHFQLNSDGNTATDPVSRRVAMREASNANANYDDSLKFAISTFFARGSIICLVPPEGFERFLLLPRKCGRILA